MFNHRPDDDQGVWVPYNTWRYKDYYDIRLVTGEVVENCRPNSDSWITDLWSDDNRTFHDDEVTHVRLKPDGELGKYCFRGEARIRRNLQFFGNAVPPKKH